MCFIKHLIFANHISNTNLATGNQCLVITKIKFLSSGAILPITKGKTATPGRARRPPTT